VTVVGSAITRVIERSRPAAPRAGPRPGQAMRAIESRMTTSSRRFEKALLSLERRNAD
jgi:hypothetical protein